MINVKKPLSASHRDQMVEPKSQNKHVQTTIG